MFCSYSIPRKKYILCRSSSYFSLVSVWIQENYLNYCPSGAGRDEDGTSRMDLIARTALSIAEGDIVNVQIRRYRQWQHAQMGAFMSSIIPYVSIGLAHID